MKKLITLAAAVVSAALFFGCSDSSDNNNAAFLLAAANSSSSVSLPASVGINELAGKTFKWECPGTDGDMYCSIYKFDSQYLTIISDNEYQETVSHSAYKLKDVFFCSYTYNSETKRIYFTGNYLSRTIVRNGIEIAQPIVITTDAEFIAYVKAWLDKLSDSEIEKQRYETFRFYGYTDSTGKEKISDVVLGRYNKFMSEISVKRSYNLSQDGKTLKLEHDSCYPQNTTLEDIYQSELLKFFTLDIEKESVPTYELNFFTQERFPERFAAIMFQDGLKGYKVSSLSSGSINISAVGTRSSTYEDFSYVNKNFSIFYTVSEITDGIEYLLKIGSEEFGKITINYATLANNTASTSSEILTLVTD